jgi:hypothetical protein
MALFEDLTIGSVTSSALIGVGVIVATPLLLPVVGAVVRPVARLAIQGGIAAYDAAATLVTTAGEELNQIVAEARAATTSVLASDTTPAPDIAPHSLRPEGANRVMTFVAWVASSGDCARSASP